MKYALLKSREHLPPPKQVIAKEDLLWYHQVHL
jgi:hypothetical protein